MNMYAFGIGSGSWIRTEVLEIMSLAGLPDFPNPHMVGLAGVEPASFRLSGGCPNLLGHRPSR